MSFLDKIGLGKRQTAPAENNETGKPVEVEAIPAASEVAKAEEKELKPEEKELKPRSIEYDLKLILDRFKAGEVTPDFIKENFQMEPKEFLGYMTGKEKINNKDVLNFNETIGKALNEQVDEGDFKPNRFKTALQSTAGRAAFVGLLLFLKFAPGAMASEHKDSRHEAKQTDTEMSTKTIKANEDKIEGGDKTFHYGETKTDEPKNLEKAAKLDLTNSFETDKADITKDGREQIKVQVREFLSQINKDNFNDLIAHDWKISGSSDPRPTSKWKNNLELTDNRLNEGINVTKEIINEEIDQMDFSHSGLSKAQLEALKSKNFVKDIANSKTGPEKGVTYLTDLKDPVTGENYTPEQIAKMQADKLNKADYENLLQKCRYVKVNLMAQADKIETITPKPLSFPDLPKFQGASEVWLALDNSPSNEFNIQNMGKHLLEMSERGDGNTKFHVGTFANSVGDFHDADDMKAASDLVKNIKIINEDKEQITKCALAVLKKIPISKNINEVRSEVIATDEAFHDVSGNYLAELEKESKARNVKMIFLFSYFDKETKKMIDSQISLEDLTKAFYKAGGPLDQQKAALEKNSKDRSGNRIIRNILLERSKNMNAEKINVSEFEVDGKIIKLPTM